MQPDPLAITTYPLTDPAVLAELAAEAEAAGWGMVSRLAAEWADGRHRFDRPGEQAYVAACDGRVAGVCGLNVDPFAADPAVGRVRRLYVAADCRRRGVGSALVRRLIDAARGRFRVLHLGTDDAGAAAFYEALGFVRVAGDPNCTHRRRLGVT